MTSDTNKTPPPERSEDRMNIPLANEILAVHNRRACACALGGECYGNEAKGFLAGHSSREAEVAELKSSINRKIAETLARELDMHNKILDAIELTVPKDYPQDTGSSFDPVDYVEWLVRKAAAYRKAAIHQSLGRLVDPGKVDAEAAKLLSQTEPTTNSGGG